MKIMRPFLIDDLMADMDFQSGSLINFYVDLFISTNAFCNDNEPCKGVNN